MLQLGSTQLTIEGISVFADHADPKQFWYLPGPVDIARRGPDKKPQFTLISYRPAVPNSNVSGGGFLNMEVALKLDSALEQRILSRLSALTKGQPRLAPVSFDEGIVKIMALDLQGSGGTDAPTTPPGTFRAVEKILGAAKPSLGGNNNVVFGLSLSQDGTIIMRQAFQEGGKPVGILYDFKYTALRPALDVEIKANLKRIYDHLSYGIDFSAGAVVYGVPVFIQANIDVAFEKLKQDGVIDIKVINYSTEKDHADKEKWALDLFKDALLNDWFKPTLPPVKFDDKNSGGLPGLSNIPRKSGSGSSSSGSDSSGSNSGSSGSTSGTSGDSASSSETSPKSTAQQGGATTTVPDTSPDFKPQQLTIQSTLPTDRPEYTIKHAPVDGGSQVTLTFEGGSAPPEVKVDSIAQTLTPQQQLTLDVPAGSALAIEANYPSLPPTEETFHLFFDYDKPGKQGWSVTPPSAAYQGYLNNATRPLDTRFQTTDGQATPVIAAATTGVEALQQWIKTRLVDPKQVKIKAYASYEGNNTLNKIAYNQALSDRRREVAEGIIGTLPSVTITSSQGHGHTDAFTAGRQGDQTDRVAKVIGIATAGSPVEIRATLSRPDSGGGQPETPTPESPTPETPEKPIPETPKPEKPKETPGSGKPGSQPPVGVKLAFTLKKIEQIEDRTLTFSYNRSDAVQKTYAPQGLIGLLAKDLVGTGHFIEIDLDHPFFRNLEITVDAPIDFTRLGLTAVNLALDYGSPNDPATLKHKDMTFSPTGAKQQSHAFSMNKALALGYRYQVQYHFDPLSGWEGKAFSYELPVSSTEDTTLLINPFNDLGFLEIKVFPDDLDAGVIDSTDVHLHYEDTDAWSVDKVITVKPDSPEQFWRLRLSQPEQRTYSYRFVHHLKDGSQRESESVTTQASSVAVNDPFENPLVVEVLPNYDTAQFSRVMVDIRYSDPDNQYQREERIQFEAEASTAQRIRIVRLNPQLKQYSFQITALGTDNSVLRIPAVETEETILFIAEHLSRSFG